MEPVDSIWYIKKGKGTPVVFLHGLGVDHRALFHIFEKFFTKKPRLEYLRFYLDLPGMGNTPPIPGIRSSDDILNLLQRLIETKLDNEPFILVGESYGGYLAQGLIHRLSSKIAASIWICPVVIPDISKRTLPPRQIISETPNFRETFSAEELKEYLRNTTVISPQNWQKFSHLIYEAQKSVDKVFITELFHKHYKISELSQNIDTSYPFPLLVLTGKQDSTVGYHDQFQLLEKYPRGSFFIIDQAGHNLLIEQTPLIYDIFEWFFNQIKSL